MVDIVRSAYCFLEYREEAEEMAMATRGSGGLTAERGDFPPPLVRTTVWAHFRRLREG